MNIEALKRRSAELKAEVGAKLKAVDAGQITTAAFTRFINDAERENNEIRDQILAYNAAKSWRTSEPGGDGAPPKGAGAHGAPASQADAELSKVLSFKGLGAELATKMMPNDITTKTPTLASSGSTVVGTEFQPSPVTLGKPAASLLDVLPVLGHGQPQFTYLRQTTRTNNAAVVADGATKPTSIYAVTQVSNALSVIAHLSDAVPRYWLLDNPSLRDFLQQELDYGLRRAVEAKVLSDIAATSGILTQAYATSPIVTIRKSLTQLETQGLDPASIVMHPSDFEAIELLLATTSAVEFQGVPYDTISRRLYGVPIVTTVQQTSGTADVLATESVYLDTDTIGLQISWSETSNATDWSQNLIRARFEGRWATSVKKPFGVVKAAVVAGS